MRAGLRETQTFLESRPQKWYVDGSGAFGVWVDGGEGERARAGLTTGEQEACRHFLRALCS